MMWESLRTPICTFDAKTGVLCDKCETKLRLGQLSHADVDGAMRITKLAERDQDINKFTMISAARIEEDFVLILRGSTAARPTNFPSSIISITISSLFFYRSLVKT